MATTFDVLYLGTAASIDATEGDTISDNAGFLVGSTFGSSGDPLYGNVQTLSPGGTAGGTAGVYDTDNLSSNDTFKIDGGSDQTFDGVAVYNATITYADGTTATITAVIAQDTSGNLYLVPETSYNTDQVALEAKPIESLTFDSLSSNTGNLSADRYAGSFATVVDGSSGDDSMGVGYTDAEGDQITSGDDWIDAGAGSDTVDAGSGNDSVYGGDGNDVIAGGSGDDSIAGGAGEDRFTFADGWGQDTVFGDEWDGTATGANNDTLDFSDVTTPLDVTFTGSEDGIATSGTNTVTFDNMEAIVGGSGDDTIDASADSSGLMLDGGAGADSISGGGGADTITGGAGDDTISGDGGPYIADQIVNGGFASDTSGWTLTGSAVYSGSNVYLGVDGGTGTLTYDTTLTGLDSGDSVNGTGQVQFDFHWGNGSPDVSGTTYVHVQIDGVTYATIQTGGLDGSTASVTYLNGASGSVSSVPVTSWASLTLDLPAGIASTGTLSYTFDAATETARDDVWIDNVEVLTLQAATGSGDDWIDGGTGADLISGEGGDDTIAFSDGFGNDTVIGGETGETSGDVLDFSAVTGPVTVTYTGDEAGTVTDGTDTITFSEIERLTLSDNADVVDASADSVGIDVEAGAGNDTITGGSGEDTIDGGTGQDSIEGGAGDDLLTGGDGNDTFVYGGGNDTITDFNAGNTGTLIDGDSTNNDFIDLSAYYDDIWELYADQADDGVLNQSNDGVGGVDYSDNSSFGGGGITFTGASADPSFFTVENTGVVCFTAGARILTPRGEVPVETLSVGDLVETADHGPQPILWVGGCHLGPKELEAHPHLRPVLIEAGALGNRRPLLVSPQHCMVVTGADGKERFARACHLAQTTLARVARGRREVSYIHLFCARHEVLFVDGAASESLYPGPQALAMMPEPSREALLDVAPALRDRPAEAAIGPRARPVLQKSQVRDILGAGRTAQGSPPAVRCRTGQPPGPRPVPRASA